MKSAPQSDGRRKSLSVDENAGRGKRPPSAERHAEREWRRDGRSRAPSPRCPVPRPTSLLVDRPRRRGACAGPGVDLAVGRRTCPGRAIRPRSRCAGAGSPADWRCGTCSARHSASRRRGRHRARRARSSLHRRRPSRLQRHQHRPGRPGRGLRGAAARSADRRRHRASRPAGGCRPAGAPRADGRRARADWRSSTRRPDGRRSCAPGRARRR